MTVCLWFGTLAECRQPEKCLKCLSGENNMEKNSIHVAIVKLSDGRQVCLSYGVIVAAYIPATLSRLHCETGGYVRTEIRYSRTTTHHVNAFAGKDAPAIPHAELLTLCAPVVSRL